MKLSELVRLACSLINEHEMENDPEVLIEADGGVMFDYKVGYAPEQFDGFETAYPAFVKLVINYDKPYEDD